MSVANNIKETRIKMGISQQELANELGVTRQLISKWETGISYPDAEQVKILSSKLDIPAHVLLDEDIPESLANTAKHNYIEATDVAHKLNVIICIALMILSCLTLPYGVMVAAVNIVYCVRQKLGKPIIIVTILILAFAIYSFVAFFVPGIVIGWARAN
jgi:transcriptional regulator with XRE-family HTH domain